MKHIISKHFNFINGLLERRYKALLICLVLMILVPFLMQGSPYQDMTSFAFNSSSILLCIYAIHESMRQLLGGIIFAIVVIVINRLGLFQESSIVDFYLSFIIYVLFYIYVVVRLMKMIVNTERVRAGVLFAAVIVYLLLGIIGGYLYMLIENAVPGSLNNLSLVNLKNPSEFFYFSFTTLSTLGYGDITPVSPPAEAVSMILSITGPLYLTVLVALLVSRYDHSDEWH